MKLHFLGANYEIGNSGVEFDLGPVGGTYRGAAWRQHRPHPVTYRHQPRQLKYRGIRYKH